MSYGDAVTDAELDIMKVLWKHGPLTSPAIFAALTNGRSKKIGTLKTLLSRLVRKGSVRCEEINARHYMYFPVMTEDEYIERNRRRLIDKVFDGSTQNLLLNFVKEEKVSKEDLESLIRQIEEE